MRPVGGKVDEALATSFPGIDQPVVNFQCAQTKEYVTLYPSLARTKWQEVLVKEKRGRVVQGDKKLPMMPSATPFTATCSARFFVFVFFAFFLPLSLSSFSFPLSPFHSRTIATLSLILRNLMNLSERLEERFESSVPYPLVLRASHLDGRLVGRERKREDEIELHVRV